MSGNDGTSQVLGETLAHMPRSSTPARPLHPASQRRCCLPRFRREWIPLTAESGSVRGRRRRALPGALVFATYACIWLWFGLSRFAVGPDATEVVWPLKRWWRVARDGSWPCASSTREGFALRSATCWALRPQAPGRRHRTSSDRGQISIALCRRAVLYEAPRFASSNA